MNSMEKIKSLSPEQFSEICRICLNSEALKLIPETVIDNIEATDIFEYTIGVLFDENDLMPDNICNKCLDTLYDMYKWKKQCLINELLFKTQINNYKTLQKDPLSRDEEIGDNIVKTEKGFEEVTIGLNGDIVSTATPEGIEEFNVIKVEPDDYDLTSDEEKGNKTEEEPEVTKILSTEHTTRPRKIEPPMIKNLNLEPSASTTFNEPLSEHQIPENTLKVPCSVCQKLIHSRGILNHLRMHKNKERLIQPQDDPTFNPSSAKQRKRTKDNPKKACLICKKIIDVRGMPAHLRSHDGPKEPKKKRDNSKVPCAICKKLVGRLGMTSHLQVHQTDKSLFQCDQCPRGFRTENKLKLHKMCHTGIYPYKCPKCNKGFPLPSVLKNHMIYCKKDRDDPKEFICKICTRIFVSRFSFRRHLRLHLERNETDEQSISEHFTDCPFSCDSCYKFYETEDSLKQHIESSHSGVSFLCTVCGKNLVSQTGLKNHMKSHTGEKAFSCEVCEQTFISSTRLKSHMYKHTDERPFKCNVCPKRFKVVVRLNNHLLLHKGVKPHKCKFCDKKFAVNESGNLRKHMATHTGEKRYFCSICDKGFYAKNIMAKHEVVCLAKAKKGIKMEEENME